MRSLIFVIPLVLLSSPVVLASIHEPPRIVTSPADLTYEVGMTGNTLIWVFEADETADSPSRYTAYLDGVSIANHTFASWSDNTDVVINVDGLTLGSYVVSIVVNDTGTDAGQTDSTVDSANVLVVQDISNTSIPPTTSSVTTTSSSISSTTQMTSTSSEDPSETEIITSNPTTSESTGSPGLPISIIPAVVALIGLTAIISSRRP